MSDEELRAEVESELRRIGIGRNAGSLGYSGPDALTQFAALLRQVPSGAGPQALRGLVNRIPSPDPIWWASYPMMRDRFTEAEYQAAFAVTMAGEGPAEHARLIMTRSQSSLEHHVLARLCVVSPALRVRVEVCRSEIRAQWKLERHSATELEAEQERWQELVAQMERAKAKRDASE